MNISATIWNKFNILIYSKPYINVQMCIWNAKVFPRRSEVLMAGSENNTISRDVMPCSLLIIHQHFEGSWCIYVRAENGSSMFLHNIGKFQSTWHHLLKDGISLFPSSYVIIRLETCRMSTLHLCFGTGIHNADTSFNLSTADRKSICYLSDMINPVRSNGSFMYHQLNIQKLYILYFVWISHLPPPTKKKLHTALTE